jgi:AbrB family looped-hinge helix DNA binding protein
MALITGVSTVSEKGQLVIPREVRQVLDVKRGDRLSWSVEENGEIRVALAKTELMSLKGRIPSHGKSVSIEDMEQAIRDGAMKST